MKSGFKRLNVSLLAICALVCATTSKAQIVTLTDLNSSAQINTASQSGMFNWMVDGVNQLYQQWFWYGIGSGTNAGPQASIDTIGAPTIQTPNARTAYITYQNSQLSAQVSYVLTGGVLGSGGSALNESIHVQNVSNGNLVLRFYQYSDFDLMGSPGGDSLQLYRNLSGKFYEAIQTKGNVVMSETDVVPGADHGEASFFPGLVNRLNGGTPITLADNTGIVGPGDTAWALEWDITLTPGASLDISKNKVISAVPEPGMLSLLGLGILAVVWRKRR